MTTEGRNRARAEGIAHKQKRGERGTHSSILIRSSSDRHDRNVDHSGSGLVSSGCKEKAPRRTPRPFN